MNYQIGAHAALTSLGLEKYATAITPAVTPAEAPNGLTWGKVGLGVGSAVAGMLGARALGKSNLIKHPALQGIRNKVQDLGGTMSAAATKVAPAVDAIGDIASILV